jgi:hypothetical protein
MTSTLEVFQLVVVVVVVLLAPCRERDVDIDVWYNIVGGIEGACSRLYWLLSVECTMVFGYI